MLNGELIIDSPHIGPWNMSANAGTSPVLYSETYIVLDDLKSSEKDILVSLENIT
jgi:hypothetical protein